MNYINDTDEIANEVEKILETESVQGIKIRLMQYKNLRMCFYKLIETVLGEDYYNDGMDVYSCDSICCEHLEWRCKRGRFSRFIYKTFGI